VPTAQEQSRIGAGEAGETPRIQLSAARRQLPMCLIDRRHDLLMCVCVQGSTMCGAELFMATAMDEEASRRRDAGQLVGRSSPPWRVEMACR